MRRNILSEDINTYAKRIHTIIPKILSVLFHNEDIKISDIDISIAKIKTLSALLESDGCSMKELKDKLNLAFSTTTENVDRLAKDKMVIRINDPNDRRIVRVKLTKKGEKLIKRFLKIREKQIAKTLEKLSFSDRNILLKNFENIFSILNKTKEDKWKN